MKEILKEATKQLVGVILRDYSKEIWQGIKIVCAYVWEKITMIVDKIVGTKSACCA